MGRDHSLKATVGKCSKNLNSVPKVYILFILKGKAKKKRECPNNIINSFLPFPERVLKGLARNLITQSINKS